MLDSKVCEMRKEPCKGKTTRSKVHRASNSRRNLKHKSSKPGRSCQKGTFQTLVSCRNNGLHPGTPQCILGASEYLPHLNQSGNQGLSGAPLGNVVHTSGTRKSLSYTPCMDFTHPVLWGQLGCPILTDWNSSPQEAGAKHFRARSVSFSVWKMGTREHD